MLRRVRVQNFLSLRDTTVDLAPFNVFIGPNASGKSAFFRSLTTLAKLLRVPLRGPRQAEFEIERGVTLDDVVWGGDDTLPICFEVWFEGALQDEPGYTLELRKVAPGWSVVRERMLLGDKWLDSAERPFEHPTEFQGTVTWRIPYHGTLSALSGRYRRDQDAMPFIVPLMELAGRIGAIWRYRPSAEDIASFVSPRLRERDETSLLMSRPTQREFEPYLGPSGQGLAWVLRKLQGQDRVIFGKIEQELHHLFDHIDSINFEEKGLGVRLAFTTTRSTRVVPAPLESDGVLHSLFLLYRLYTGGPGMSFCLEEPENGTHPYLLEGRYKLLKRFAARESAVRTNHLLVATHSPDLLTAIESPQEAVDVVRVVERDPQEGTKIHRLGDSEEVELLLEAFRGNVGELWWSGAIGGTPPVPHG